MARSNTPEYDRAYYQKRKHKLRKKHLENYYAHQTYYRLCRLHRYHLKRGNKERAKELQEQMRLMLVGSQRRTRNKSTLKRSRKFVTPQSRAAVSSVPRQSPPRRTKKVETDSHREAQIRPEIAEISDLQESIPERSAEELAAIRKVMYGDET